MPYFEPIPLPESARKRFLVEPTELEFTPEFFKEIPNRVADLYKRMPDLAANENPRLKKITLRVIDLYENQNVGLGRQDLEASFFLASLAGTLPPLLLSHFANRKDWTELMGLVLLTGFCPCTLTRSPLSKLLRENPTIPNGNQNPAAEEILEYNSSNNNLEPWLLRLDGLTLSIWGKKTRIYGNETVHCFGPLPEYMSDDPNYAPGDLDETGEFIIVRKDSSWQNDDQEAERKQASDELRQQFRNAIIPLLEEWPGYKRAKSLRVLEGEKVLFLSPSEFVRFAQEIKFDIPWLGFAQEHFPHLLPEPEGEDQQPQPPEPEDKDQHDQDQSTERKNGPKREETKKRLAALRAAAKKIWDKHSDWSVNQVAREIKRKLDNPRNEEEKKLRKATTRTEADKTYSVDHIRNTIKEGKPKKVGE